MSRELLSSTIITFYIAIPILYTKLDSFYSGNKYIQFCLINLFHFLKYLIISLMIYEHLSEGVV